MQPSVHSPFRALRAAMVLGFGLSLAITVGAQIAPAGTVASVQNAGEADLVVLDHGFDAGLRQGMVCRVVRGSAEIAEILLVDLRPSCSAALILSVTPQQSIRPGDLASVKILKS